MYYNDLITGVSGFIPKATYDEMLQQQQFHHYPEQDFHGYNNPYFPFPFWSSEAFTYSAALLALTQHEVMFKTVTQHANTDEL